MNGKEKAIKAYKAQSGLGKTMIMHELGYTNPWVSPKTLHADDLLFAKWIRDNDKMPEFINKCEPLYKG